MVPKWCQMDPILVTVLALPTALRGESEIGLRIGAQMVPDGARTYPNGADRSPKDAKWSHFVSPNGSVRAPWLSKPGGTPSVLAGLANGGGSWIVRRCGDKYSSLISALPYLPIVVILCRVLVHYTTWFFFFAIGDPSSVIPHQSSIMSHPSSAIRHQSSIISHPSSVIHHQSSIISHPSCFGSRRRPNCIANQ